VEQPHSHWDVYISITVEPTNERQTREIGKIVLKLGQAIEWLWTHNNDLPKMAIGGITPAPEAIIPMG